MHRLRRLHRKNAPSKKALNEFNRGLNTRTAIYIPFAQAIPNVAVIDTDQLHQDEDRQVRHLRKGLPQPEPSTTSRRTRSWSEQYGAIVVATGFNPINLDKYDEYAYIAEQGRDHLSGAGAADERRRPHRRARCCGPPTAKHPQDDRVHPVRGLPLRRQPRASPTAQRSAACTPPSTPCSSGTSTRIPTCTVFYIDVRTPGKNFDEFYRRAVEEYGVNYIKGQVGKVAPQSDGKPAGAGQSTCWKTSRCTDRGGHGGAGHRHRAGPGCRASDGYHADRLHGYQRFLHRGAPQAAARGMPHGGRVPVRRVPGA